MPSVAYTPGPLAPAEAYNLPASWYRSKQIYELERRAIFSKKWLFTTHSSRLADVGEYILFQVAGYNFFIIKDREGAIRAFQNVCRHRAFPILGSKKEGEARPTTEAGKTSILACKYHGWSYTMKGALAKAPGFDTVPSFVPADNGLWDIRVHTDKLGFIWVCMDKSEDAISWKEQMGDFDSATRLKNVDMSGYNFDHNWSLEDCQYNWKTLLDNYNECYHCQTSHPGIAKTTDLKTYFVKPKDHYIGHHAVAKPGFKEGHRQGSDIYPYFMFPFSSITVTPNYIYTMRVVPTGPTTTSMQYDVYRHKNATTEVFNETNEAFVQIENEDKFLCTNAQRNISAGTYNTGALHPTREMGVIYFQKLVRDALTSHRALEEAAGHDISPALAMPRGETAEDLFCKKLQSGCTMGDKLDW